MKKNKALITITTIIVGLLLVNFIASKVYKRIDLTKDGRYTLSDASKSLISDLDSPLIIDVFLEGDFP